MKIRKLSVAIFGMALHIGMGSGVYAQNVNQDIGAHGTMGITQMGVATGLERKTPMDRDFLIETALGNTFSIQASKIAAERSSNSDVRDFAQKLLSDHQQLSNELIRLANSRGLSFSSSLDPLGKMEIEVLRKSSPMDFDKRYLRAMIKQYKKDINNFQLEASGGQDPDVKDFAAGHIDDLQHHLTAAENLEKRF